MAAGPRKRWTPWWRQADQAELADKAQSELLTQLPLPLALLVGVSLVLLWEAVHPRSGPNGSSIVRQVGRMVFGASQPQGIEGVASRRHSVAAALKEKMNEISFWAPRRCLTRAASALVPRLHGGEHASAGMELPAQAVADWLELEEGSGPLALCLPARGSVVFFAQHTVVAQAGSTEVALALFRAGDLSHELSVSWSTMDGTAHAGVDFEECSGSVRFAAGAAVAELRVELLPQELVFTQRFFVVHVESVGRSATMGSLPFARVRLLDDGVWPPGLTSGPLAALARGSWARIRAGHRLVGAFVLMLVRFRGRKYWEVVCAVLWKDFHQVVLNALLLNFALYDLCLTRVDDPAAYRRLLTVVCSKFLLVLFDRVADHFISTTTGAGPCARLVQGHVLHKYLEMRHDPINLGRFYHLFFDTAPECVAFAYGPTFKMIHGAFTLFLSFLMALAVPMLRGNPVSPKTLQPLFGIVVLVPLAFLLALPARRADFEALVQKRRDAHAEVCGALQEVLACRHGVRAFDGAYPAQQVRQTFDYAHARYGGMNGDYFEFKDDTQWVATYLGELAKLVALLYGGCEALNHARTGVGTMTLGQFAVIISLYGAIVGAFYDFIEAWGGFAYARILLIELADFFGEHPSPWCGSPALMQPADIVHEWLTVKFDSVHLDMELEDAGVFPRQVSDPSVSNSHGVTAEIPLGCIYAMAASEGWSCTRRYVAALLGGATSSCRGCLEFPSFARSLMVSPPASLAEGSVLENLLSYAAAWVRGSDALAVVAALGVPFEAPSGVTPLHDLRCGHLLEVLGTSVASSAEAAQVKGRPRLRQLPAAAKGDEELLAKAVAAFRARMAAAGVAVLSPMAKVEPLLRPHELQILDLARGLLADPDMLVVQDTLSALPAFHARSVLRFMQAWQRLGGLRGVVCAWERGRLSEAEPIPEKKAEKAARPKIATAHSVQHRFSCPPTNASPQSRGTEPPAVFDSGVAGSAAPPPDPPARGDYPAWLTEAGGLCRTLVLSESALVTAGLELRSRVDTWLMVGLDRLEVTAADSEATGAANG